MFAPTWIVKQQNDEIGKYFLEDALESYISRKWLEITCGEAPYMASRYEMEAVIHNMSNSPPIIAQKVIEGEFGNGEERVKRLTEAGYDATEVQEEVNRMMSEEGGESNEDTNTETTKQNSDCRILCGIRESQLYRDDDIETIAAEVIQGD